MRIKADVRLARSTDVSPRHTQLWVREGKIMLRHLGGVRKTFATGQPIDWLILEEGDEFSIGAYRYRVEPVSANGGTSHSRTDSSS